MSQISPDEPESMKRDSVSTYSTGYGIQSASSSHPQERERKKSGKIRIRESSNPTPQIQTMRRQKTAVTSLKDKVDVTLSDPFPELQYFHSSVNR